MKNPVRLLLHVPVPWVFVLTYLLGVVLRTCASWHHLSNCGLG
jgi:hypothetical protein